MKKYAVIYSREDLVDTKVFDFIGDAIKEANDEYSYLTRQERKNTTIEIAPLTEKDLADDAFEGGEVDWTLWKQYTPYKFGVRDREAGNIIETCTTPKRAGELLATYEEIDKSNDTYAEVFYEICVDYGDGWETYFPPRKYASQDRYDVSNTKKYSIKLNISTDADIIEWLEAQDSKQGAIKQAIRESIKPIRLRTIESMFDAGFEEIKLIPHTTGREEFTFHRKDIEEGGKFHDIRKYTIADFEEEFAGMLTFC